MQYGLDTIFRRIDVVNEEYLEVDFKKYCKTCKHKELGEKFDPCNACLDYGYNLNSHKPLMWEEKKK
jgi:hypothetical protein